MYVSLIVFSISFNNFSKCRLFTVECKSFICLRSYELSNESLMSSSELLISYNSRYIASSNIINIKTTTITISAINTAVI